MVGTVQSAETWPPAGIAYQMRISSPAYMSETLTAKLVGLSMSLGMRPHPFGTSLLPILTFRVRSRIYHPEPSGEMYATPGFVGVRSAEAMIYLLLLAVTDAEERHRFAHAEIAFTGRVVEREVDVVVDIVPSE